MSIHLTNDQLIDHLYGIAEPDAHLDSCPECQARWNQLQQSREESAIAAPSAEFFRKQRRAIQNGIMTPAPALNIVWVPATLAAVLMAGLLITHDSPQPEPAPRALPETLEAGWFEDTYSATRILEPRAASPIHELFPASKSQGSVME